MRKPDTIESLRERCEKQRKRIVQLEKNLEKEREMAADALEAERAAMKKQRQVLRDMEDRNNIRERMLDAAEQRANKAEHQRDVLIEVLKNVTAKHVMPLA